MSTEYGQKDSILLTCLKNNSHNNNKKGKAFTKTNGCLQLHEILVYEKNLNVFSSDISAQYVELEIKY